jgi:hypothetical protein
MEKGAKRAPQLIKILLAVLPVALCQGLFYHCTQKGMKKAR